MIGKGGFGTVYRGRWRGTIVAIKKMNVDARLSPEKYQEFVNEC